MKAKIRNVLIVFVCSYGAYLLISNFQVYSNFIKNLLGLKNVKEKLIIEYSEKIKNDPKNFSNYYNRGLFYMDLKEYDKAIKDFDNTLSLENEYTPALSSKSIAFLAKKDPENALKSINKAIKIWPEITMYYYERALIYDYQNKSKKAIDDYTHFIKSKKIKDFPNKYNFALRRRAINYYKINQYEKVMHDLNKSIDNEPDNKELLKIKKIIDEGIKNSKQITNRSILSINLEEAIEIEW
jgi:tetratricopeptide (TPR) repeat protein